ncbi:Uncharacterized protein FWK35_00033026, partial [Aphis craccivora]
MPGELSGDDISPSSLDNFRRDVYYTVSVTWRSHYFGAIAPSKFLVGGWVPWLKYLST